ncbi:MAG: ion transporter [Clostridium sp.]
MRERTYQIISKEKTYDPVSHFYDLYIMALAFFSVIPLMFRNPNAVEAVWLSKLETATVFLLLFDYVLRWMTHDYRIGNHTIWAFIRYPFTPLAIIDILSILPSLGLLPQSFMILRLFRITKILEYSTSYRHIMDVFKKQGRTLLSVLVIAVFYIFASALIMFVEEPASTFDNFFHALYWATTALTTVGYGDVYPVTNLGRLISMISSLFGIAVIALPAGIVTAGFVDAIDNDVKERKKYQKEKIAIQKKQKGKSKITPVVRRYALVMFIGIIINFTCYLAAHYGHLPMWIDMVGTCYVAMALEPAAGLVIGFLISLVQAILYYDSASVIYYATVAASALIVGILMRKDGKICLKRIVPVMALFIVVDTIVAGGISIWEGGLSSGWELYFQNLLMTFAPVPEFVGVFFGTFVLKVADGIVMGILLPIFWILTPKTWRNEEFKDIVSIKMVKTEDDGQTQQN